MKQVGKHAWATPKCGISLVTNVWKDIQSDSEYQFLLARNPYNRIVSLFAEKVVDVNGRFARRKGLPLNKFQERLESMRGQASIYCKIEDYPDLKLMTFKKFCLSIRPESVQRGDEHIKKQSSGSPDHEFDDIIWMEDLPQCFEIPKKKLGIDIDVSQETLFKLGGPKENDNHYTPKSKELNSLNSPWNMTAVEWLEHGSMPSDYSKLFDEELKDHIYNLYRDDFDYFKLDRMK